MEIIGVIAEYNPFHKGHLYHINKIKELYPDSLLILVLNGYFMQRGELSVLTKEAKTRIALDYKIDLVLELPFIFGTQSADTFAYYSLAILNHFKVDKIVFGSEGNDLKLLHKIADMALNNPDYDSKVTSYLKQGLNYPTALAKALDLEEDFNTPNDLLGISYIKAIKQINPKIEAVTITRTNQYHDLLSNEEIISASNIRAKIQNNLAIEKFIPVYPISLLIKIDQIKLFNLLKYKLLSDDNLARYLTVDEGIENRLREKIMVVNSFEELITAVKTKRYTYNKIKRMLTHLLVGLTKEDNQNRSLAYIKVLGFNKQGQKYLYRLKKKILIPLKVDYNSSQAKYELRASQIYDLLTKENTYQFELNQKPIKKD